MNKEKILSKEYRPAHHLRAINWKAFTQSAIKTGLESPTPYKVIPYKNGRGIKKIEFIKPIKYSKKQGPSLEALYNN